MVAVSLVFTSAATSRALYERDEECNRFTVKAGRRKSLGIWPSFVFYSFLSFFLHHSLLDIRYSIFFLTPNIHLVAAEGRAKALCLCVTFLCLRDTPFLVVRSANITWLVVVRSANND
jgi:hypothetical protein